MNRPHSSTNLAAWNHLPLWLCWLIILTFALFFSYLSLQQHWSYQTHGLDVGNVDQALWNTAH
ncbi:MAG: hypothetical protein AAF485_25830, partial [Chloroflexota bacterium]